MAAFEYNWLSFVLRR